jgi:uncharacterized protein YbjT (DUF2867 family)
MSNCVVARAGLPIDRPASRLALRAPTLRAATALTRSARSPFGGSCSSRERCWRIRCTRPRDCVSISVRIASRHPDRSRGLFGSGDPQLRAVGADIRDQRTVADALADAYGAVNAVSLYVEHSVHVEAAERVAVQAHRVGVERLAHVSGLGADAASPSLYIRKRGEGELAVKAAFTDVILFRPAVMFGPDDAFLTTILELLRRLPIYPMFGRGRTRLQPAYVEDVAEAIARALQRTQTHAITFECGGPRVYSYEELLRALARDADLKRILIPLPFAAWRALAWTAELLPNPPVTRNQVELMQVDNVCSPGVPGFAELGISPHSVENMLEQTLRSR